jgi:putative adenylate-forming enzyme|tara:strand:- start:2148 stop:3344 length:1197 start_codon:yes stop_codon:yes gene_type:complete
MRKNWIKTLSSSPYYSDLLKNNQKFPTMKKKLFMEFFDSINTVGIKKEEALKLAFESEKTRDFSPSIKNISIGLSSGTSGNRGVFLTSKIEKAIWVGAILDRVIGFSLKKRKVAFFLRANNNLYQAVKSGLLSFTFFDLKTPIEEHIKKLMDIKADILIGQPSVLLAIAKSYQLADIKPTFNKIISVAEVLEDDHKEFLKSIFNCPINQVYQCTEGFLGYTCKKGQLHLNEDFLEIKKKYLDSNKTRFHPIITDYLRSSQPIVRYELNDILHEGPVCSCGSKSTVISKIEGRSDDIFRFLKNGNEIIIYPDFIRRAVILASDQILNYSVTLIDKQIISLYLDVEKTSELPEIFKSVKFEIEKLLSEFDIANIDFVKANKKLDQLNKFTRIKNEYSKSI